MTCKGICSRYKARKPVGVGRYAVGQRRCQICEIFIKVEGLWCPCCGYRLRTKPRNILWEAKYRAAGNGVRQEEKELFRVNPDDKKSIKKSTPAEPEPQTNPDDEMWLHDCPTAKMIISTYGEKCTHCKITRKEAEAA